MRDYSFYKVRINILPYGRLNCLWSSTFSAAANACETGTPTASISSEGWNSLRQDNLPPYFSYAVLRPWSSPGTATARHPKKMEKLFSLNSVLQDFFQLHQLYHLFVRLPVYYQTCFWRLHEVLFHGRQLNYIFQLNLKIKFFQIYLE